MVTKTVDIDEASRNFAKVLEVAIHGGQVLLCDPDHKPVVKIVPFRERLPGLNPGGAQIADDFDVALDDAFWLGDR